MSELNKRTSSARRSETSQAKPARSRANAHISGSGAVQTKKTAGAKTALRTQTVRPAQHAKADSVKPVVPVKKTAAPQQKTENRKPERPKKAVDLKTSPIGSKAGKTAKGTQKPAVSVRKQAWAIIIKCAVFTIIVSLLIAAYLMVKPSLDASRAQELADNRQAMEALRIVEELERKNYDKDALATVKMTIADILIDENKLDEAREVLSSINKTEDTRSLTTKLDYHYANSLYAKGEYAQAAQIYYQMQDYLDAGERYYDCRCALAIKAYLDGQVHEEQMPELLAEIPNMAERVQRVASDMTSGQSDEMSAQIKDVFNEEKLKSFELMVDLFSGGEGTAQKGRIAAGHRHTLGLQEDGKVLAAGDNTYGQCNVDEWSDVTQIAAGAYHSVALRKDGTVVAVGDNSQNQLDVGGWTDIVAVAASGYDTIGLKSDGTVVVCGMHADRVSGWHGVTLITGGAYSLGCLYDKGYMMTTHAGAQMKTSVALYDLSVCGNVSVGVTYSGSLVTNIENSPDWTNLVTVEVSSTGILAIDMDGNVLSYFYRESDNVNFDLPSEAVEVASSGTHHVVLTQDGSVYCFGDNEFGQLNTSGWDLLEE